MSELYVIVRGNVTGVGFRAWVEDTAHDLGLKGWVSNKDIGVVVAIFQGEKLALEKMLELIGRGPDGSRVESVENYWRIMSRSYEEFRVIQ